jgi:hypothetical protein
VLQMHLFSFDYIHLKRNMDHKVLKILPTMFTLLNKQIKKVPHNLLLKLVRLFKIMLKLLDLLPSLQEKMLTISVPK